VGRDLSVVKWCTTERLICFTLHGYVFSSSSATELFSSSKVIVGLSMASLTNLLLVRLEGFDRWPFLDGFWVVCCICLLLINNSTNSVHWNWWNPLCTPVLPPGYSCMVCISKKKKMWKKLRWRLFVWLFPCWYFIMAYRSSSLTVRA